MLGIPRNIKIILIFSFLYINLIKGLEILKQVALDNNNKSEFVNYTNDKNFTEINKTYYVNKINNTQLNDYTKIDNVNNLTLVKGNITVIGQASEKIKSLSFKIISKLYVENNTQETTYEDYKEKLTNLLFDLSKLNVTADKINFSNYTLKRDVQKTFLIIKKPVHFYSSSDMIIDTENFLPIVKYLKNQSLVKHIEVFYVFNTTKILEEIKIVLNKAFDNAFENAKSQLDNKNLQISNIIHTKISLNTFKEKNDSFVYNSNVKNDDLRYDNIDIKLVITFETQEKILDEDKYNDYIKQMKENAINKISNTAKTAYIQG